MPDTYTYPGVYIQEVPSGIHPIAGVTTSSTAFVDQFQRGPMNTAVQVTSWLAFTTIFGGLMATSEASYAVQQFFLNGGTNAWIVRVAGSTLAPTLASATLVNGTTSVLTVNASSPGAWGTGLQVVATVCPGSTTNFNLLVQLVQSNSTGSTVAASEAFTSLSMSPQDPNYAVAVVNAGSKLVQLVDDGAKGELPTLVTPDRVKGVPSTAWIAFSKSADGAAPDASALLGDQSTTGIYALDRISPSIFNLLCIPVIGTLGLSATDYGNLVSAVEAFCVSKRAFLILDAPKSVTDEPSMSTWFGTVGVATPNAAIYYPSLQIPDLLNGGRARTVGASGTIAGIYARTDAARGVWKAPAGVDATLAGATITTNITDLEQGLLNPLGINVIRNFPLYGSVVWGARTLNGADALASPWKYIPVRRTALYIEESLYEGLRWATFEPNDEVLWAQIRASVDEFMSDLFRQGAFQGTTPDQAYLVKCDSDTTQQSDIDRGAVNVLVGFAPLKPAEFVVLQIEQLAGQGS
jgi:phage tail sheath protein FI